MLIIDCFNISKKESYTLRGIAIIMVVFIIVHSFLKIVSLRGLALLEDSVLWRVLLFSFSADMEWL